MREPAAGWSGGLVLHLCGRTCLSAFVKFGFGSRARAKRWCSKAANGIEDGAHHRAGDRDLGHLEGDGAGVAHDAGPDPDHFELQAVSTGTRGLQALCSSAHAATSRALDDNCSCLRSSVALESLTTLWFLRVLRRQKHRTCQSRSWYARSCDRSGSEVGQAGVGWRS